MALHLSILGSTGSIGRQSLEIAEAFPDDYKVVGLSAGQNVGLLKTQIKAVQPQVVSVLDKSDVEIMAQFIKTNKLNCEVVWGEAGNCTVATHPQNEKLIVAIVGTAALLPTALAIQKGINVGLACKEVLVSAGDIIMQMAKDHDVEILPIDSEHAAIHQCLAGQNGVDEVDKLTLTASGGPFRTLAKEKFASITKSDALKHPNWSMGNKITIDSATLANKGLEVIEAHHLFQVPYDQIEVVVHPQSMIHSFVSFIDGNTLCQLGPPDMRLPIGYVMSYPKKNQSPWPKLNLQSLQDLSFEAPDFERFPHLKLAFEVGKLGGTYPAVFNAANEAIVALFLAEKIAFLEMYVLLEKSLTLIDHLDKPTLTEIIDIDKHIKMSLTTTYKEILK